MYYNQSATKTFWISFLTSLVVSGAVAFSVVYFAPSVLGKKTETKIEVPDIEHLDLQTAQMIIDRKNLCLVIKERRNDPTIKKDRIIYQNPTPGTEVAKGEIVRVVISEGASPSEQNEIIIPDVTGFDLNQARVFLAEKGLTVGKVEEQISSEPKGKVIGTVPEPGRKITKDVTIKLIISMGPEKVSVPNLKRKSLYQAKEILRQNGLKLGNVSYTTSAEYAFDIIISQHPKAGGMVERGSSVNITINREAP